MYAKTSSKYVTFSSKDEKNKTSNKTSKSPKRGKTDLLASVFKPLSGGSTGGKELLDRKFGLAHMAMVSPALVSKLADTPDQAQQILRKELLLARSGRSSVMGTTEDKHYYNQSRTNFSDTEATIPLCRVTGGTATNTRTTNAIAVKGFKFRYVIRRIGTATGSVIPRDPILTLVFWRDKIPATVGTPPTILGTDANPPASTTLMFSRLGTSDTRMNSIAIKNPVTALDYHIYEIHHHNSNQADWYIDTSAKTSAGPHSVHREVFIDTHRVAQIYATYAATAPDVNDLYCTIYSDIDYTNVGFVDEIEYSIDTEFEDIGDQ